MIEDKIYDELFDMKNAIYTKAEFSREYLGKCRTYYNATRTNKRPVSKTALVNCWNKLREDVKACDDSMKYANNSYVLSSIKERRERLNDMSRQVLEALIEQREYKGV